MRMLDVNEVQEVGGGQPAVSTVLAAVGLGIAVCTAPAWGAIGALVGLGALFYRTLE